MGQGGRPWAMAGSPRSRAGIGTSWNSCVGTFVPASHWAAGGPRAISRAAQRFNFPRAAWFRWLQRFRFSSSTRERACPHLPPRH